MMGQYVASQVAAVLSEHGETMVLAREGEGTSVTLKGKRVSGGNTVDVGGSAVQQTFTVRIAPTELAASAWAVKVPRRHDVLTVAGIDRSVLDAFPMGDGDTVALYELQVAG